MYRINIARSDEDIQHCFRVLSQLRPHLSPDDFVSRIRSMQAEGFVLAALQVDGAICAVAGFRTLDLLYSGRTLYVDDLVTDMGQRSKGHGAALLDWLRDQASQRGCATLTLDSGVQRADAHRFYLREGLSIVGYHFEMPLGPPAT